MREDPRSPSAPAKVEVDNSQSMVRTVTSMVLRYGPLQLAGPFLLSIQVDGAQVTGSPFMLNCKPAPPVAFASSFDVEHVDLRAGEAAALSITSRDRYGNCCRVGGAQLAVFNSNPEDEPDRLAALAAPPPLYHSGSLGRGEAIEVSDLRDGTYTATVTFFRAGWRRLHATLDGAPLRGHGVEVQVHAGALHAPSCVPGGAAVESFVVVGVPATLTLQARDRFGNACSRTGRGWVSQLEILEADGGAWRLAEPPPTVRADGASTTCSSAVYLCDLIAPTSVLAQTSSSPSPFHRISSPRALRP